MIETEAQAKDWLESLPEYDETAKERLDMLVLLLREENQRQNLVSSASLEEVWRRHIVDSAQLLQHVPRETFGSWLDLGTGAGFPGLVVATLRPELPVFMVESRSKRVDWLERARIALDLSAAKVFGSRLEQLESRNVSVISARAFAPLERLLGLSARFSTRDTIWLLPKGRSAKQELAELRGWNHLFHVEQSITDADAGVIVGTLRGSKGKSA